MLSFSSLRQHSGVSPVLLRNFCRAISTAPLLKNPKIILHGFPNSGTCFLTRFALHAKGAKFEEQPLNVRMKPDGTPDTTGPSSKPWLEVDGLRIDMPGAIFNFVNERLEGPALLPASAEGRARSRTLASFCLGNMMPFQYWRVVSFLKADMGLSDAQVQKWRRHWLEDGFEQVEDWLKNPEALCLSLPGGNSCAAPEPGRFCIGDSVSMADIFLMPQVYWSQKGDAALRVDLSKYPHLKKVYENTAKEEAFVKSCPENI
uniref:GST C-terminal domain-containing protein n=1 Tax=Chromera velia CCMP2878 TaxID=1169474 RepID=A0A0G4HZK1_9ALVE|eukprot:Cvel_1588.t1-p1 / transcript=Cvel_1588.t1 / gene=Cvel_1588 / organism=Chromera_velia_CCMP2878 / gene_product=Probable maleylacetoacetate isomerase, putative / transcript_product=Probable maleylacetoacetate isomerase, putative / location=Cvel_scaffold56:134617-137958(+) / protein_length=259 / sequence_SO=supercontig / SO=protein_coding / is_pseudo=false